MLRTEGDLHSVYNPDFFDIADSPNTPYELVPDKERTHMPARDFAERALQQRRLSSDLHVVPPSLAKRRARQ